MSEPLIHREEPSDDAFRRSAGERQTVKGLVLGVVRTAGPNGAILDDIKRSLRECGLKAHHGTISSSIHSLEAEGAIVQKDGGATRKGVKGHDQRVMVIRTDGVVPEIHRPPLPATETIDAALAAMRRADVWLHVRATIDEGDVDALVECLQYLRDLNAWRVERL